MTPAVRRSRAAPNGPPPAGQADASSLSDIGHAILDVVGMVPLVGEAADGINAAWYRYASVESGSGNSRTISRDRPYCTS
jgi:hypothetical protein